MTAADGEGGVGRRVGGGHFGEEGLRDSVLRPKKADGLICVIQVGGLNMSKSESIN